MVRGVLEGLIAGEEQRFGFGELALAKQRFAEERRGQFSQSTMDEDWLMRWDT